jgi:uncharacterized protein
LLGKAFFECPILLADWVKGGLSGLFIKNFLADNMSEIEFDLKPNGRGAFFIAVQGDRFAEMEFGISGKDLTVYHTTVSDTLKGQGVAAKLLSAMIEYARTNNLKVIPLCSYVSAQFNRHPEEYADSWNKDWHK